MNPGAFVPLALGPMLFAMMRHASRSAEVCGPGSEAWFADCPTLAAMLHGPGFGRLLADKPPRRV